MNHGLHDKAILLASALLAALTMACAVSPGDTSASRTPAAPVAASPVSGSPAAPLKFTDVAGIHAEMAKSRGRPVVINFWATWCVPCMKEMPDLAEMSRDFAKDGPDFLGVSLDAWVIASDTEAEKKVRDALAEAGVAFPNLIYRGDQDPLVDGFNLPGPIPYSVLYNREGKQVSSWIGGLEREELKQALARIP